MRDALVGESSGETLPQREVTSKPAQPPPSTGWWKIYPKTGGYYIQEDNAREYFLGGNVGGWWVTREGYLWVDDTGRPWDYV